MGTSLTLKTAALITAAALLIVMAWGLMPTFAQQPPEPGPLTGFTLVDASDQSELAALTDGATVHLDDPDGRYAIRANVDSAVGSVQMELSGARTVAPRTENIVPYSLYGDYQDGSVRKLNGEALPAGSYMLETIAYSQRTLGGDKLGTLRVSFTIAALMPTPTPTRTPAPTITPTPSATPTPTRTPGAEQTTVATQTPTSTPTSNSNATLTVDSAGTVSLDWRDDSRAERYAVDLWMFPTYRNLPRNGIDITMDGSSAVVSGLPTDYPYYAFMIWTYYPNYPASGSTNRFAVEVVNPEEYRLLPTATPTVTPIPPTATPTPVGLPARPNQPTAEMRSDGSVALEWDAVDLADSYEVWLWHHVVFGFLQRWVKLPFDGLDIQVEGYTRENIGLEFGEDRLSAVVTNLPVKEWYYFVVRAVNDVGPSGISEQVGVENTLEQTATSTPIPTPTGTPTPTATATPTLTRTSTPTVTPTATATPTPTPTSVPLTVEFLTNTVPSSHSGAGRSFAVRVRFSEAVPTGYRILRDRALRVTNGEAIKFRRVNGSSALREIHVMPDSNSAVTLVLAATTDCSAAAAICTADGRPLSNGLSLTIPGPSRRD